MGYSFRRIKEHLINAVVSPKIRYISRSLEARKGEKNKYLADTKNIAENIYDADKEKANQLMKRWISGIISYADA